MNKVKKREINVLDLQIIITLIYIGSLIISIYITNIDKDTLINENKKHPNTTNISIFNRALVLILTLGYLYISYENRKLAKVKGERINLFNLQILSSQFSTIASIIVLYVVITSSGNNYTIVPGISNPNL